MSVKWHYNFYKIAALKVELKLYKLLEKTFNEIEALTELQGETQKKNGEPGAKSGLVSRG